MHSLSSFVTRSCVLNQAARNLVKGFSTTKMVLIKVSLNYVTIFDFYFIKFKTIFKILKKFFFHCPPLKKKIITVIHRKETKFQMLIYLRIRQQIK